MATNILLVNQKGGVGKTTFADEIAWGLERRGHKVGFGNLDPQGGANHEKGLLDDEDAVNVVDTPGFLSDDTAEYAKNADIAIIPVQPGTLGLKPMKRTIKVITEANPDLSFAIMGFRPSVPGCTGMIAISAFLAYSAVSSLRKPGRYPCLCRLSGFRFLP